jgi:hypothetical protein
MLLAETGDDDVTLDILFFSRIFDDVIDDVRYMTNAAHPYSPFALSLGDHVVRILDMRL